MSFGTPPPDVTDDVELSSEQETGGELRRRLVLPSATGKERRRLLRLDLLPPLFRFLLELLSLLSLRLLFRLFRAAGGGLGGGPLGSLGGPDLSRCRLKPLLGGRGDRLLERFLGTENDRDLDRGVGCLALLATGAGEVTTFLLPLGEHTEQDSSEHELSERELGVSDAILGVRRLGCCG